MPDLGLNPSRNVHSLSKAIFSGKILFSNRVGESKKAQVLHMKHDYDFEEFRDYGLLLLMTITHVCKIHQQSVAKRIQKILYVRFLAESTQVKW